MYNLRYHLASLASVFLALAVGLMLGGLIADKAPSAAQDALVKGIEADIAQTREQNTQLRSDNKNLNDFSDMLLQGFTAGRLNESRILILGRNNKDGNTTVAALEKAGAATIVLLPIYDEETESWSLDEEILSNPELPLDAIVNVFEPTDDDKGDLEGYLDFLESLTGSTQLTLICASADTEETRLVDLAWTKGFSGTNQLQSRFGAYTLVALLTGGNPGLYGTTNAATALFPPLPPEIAGEPAEEPTP